MLYYFRTQPVIACVCHVSDREDGGAPIPHAAEAGFLTLSRACGRTWAIEYEAQMSTISREGYVVVHIIFEVSRGPVTGRCMQG